MGNSLHLLGLFLVFFKQTLQFLQQYDVKNVQLASGGGIWTHDLLNVSLLSKPLDQGSHPFIPTIFASTFEGRFFCQNIFNIFGNFYLPKTFGNSFSCHNILRRMLQASVTRWLNHSKYWAIYNNESLPNHTTFCASKINFFAKFTLKIFKIEPKVAKFCQIC